MFHLTTQDVSYFSVKSISSALQDTCFHNAYFTYQTITDTRGITIAGTLLKLKVSEEKLPKLARDTCENTFLENSAQISVCRVNIKHPTNE